MNRRFCFLLLIAFVAVSLSSSQMAFATIINIPDDYPTIQQGIDASSDGDTVLVQPGTYVENINFNGHNIVLGSLYLTTGDTSYISQTVIDGGLSGTVVIFEYQEDSTAMIRGFTIQNGSANYGGGIYCWNTEPLIINNIILNNIANWDGGGIFCWESNATIMHNDIIDNSAFSGAGIFCWESNPDIVINTIRNNYSEHRGGGICCWRSNPAICYNNITHNLSYNGSGLYCSESDPLVAINTILGNSASDQGGGVYCTDSNPIIIDNTLVGNFANGDGGGIYCWISSPAITNNIINGNRVHGRGGGISCWSSDPNINDNTISYNIAFNHGGGLFCYESGPALINNTIDENSTDSLGGGIYCEFSSPALNNNLIINNLAIDGAGIYCGNNSEATITGNTISGNCGSANGAGFTCYESNPIITNNILWDNSFQELATYDCSPTVTYCCIRGGWQGEGNIAIDPLFVEPLTNNFNICIQSLCIDSGDPHIQDPDSTRSDIGVYFPDHPECDLGRVWYVSVTGNDDSGDGSSDNPFRTIQHAINISLLSDTIIVENGIYLENLNVVGKNVLIASNYIFSEDTLDILSTIIYGMSNSSVVIFSNCDSLSAIKGFTIRGGNNSNGGGIQCYYSHPMIKNNIISMNSADNNGGGISCEYSSPVISGNIISENSAALNGGGISCYQSSPLIVYNIINENVTGSSGGGISTVEYSNPLITNNFIIDNSADDKGGAIFCYQHSNPDIVNNTISENSAGDFGGGIYSNFCDPYIVNNIFWHNIASSGNELILVGGSPLVVYCDIQGDWEGEGNFYQNPLFIDPHNSNFNLCSQSPCINTGNPEIQDPDGTRSDIGVYFPDHPECDLGNVLFVSVNGNDSTGDGSEGNPYRTIQYACNQAFPLDTVLVENGIYIENIIFDSKTICVASSYVYSADTLDIRNTVIDGDSSASVLTFERCDSLTSIIGLTISNGCSQYGGGIYCNASDINVIRNIISWNTTFEGGRGGGIYCTQSDPRIDDNLIRNNTASMGGRGGGILCNNSHPRITNNIICNNTAEDELPGTVSWGGGIFCHNDSYPIISRNTIKENYASDGGGIHCWSTDPTITNNLIIGNRADYGGGIICLTSFANVINNTFSYNIANRGGGMICSSRSPRIINNIFWADSAQTYPEIYVASGSPIIIYCNIQGGWDGEGNIDVNPLFRFSVDPENCDFHLMAIEYGYSLDSPCIDAGHPDILDSVLDSLWGLGTVLSDMGAYGGGDSVQVGITDQEVKIPDHFTLSQNYPNPFNPVTTIHYNLPKACYVVINIYDILGRKVTTLINEEQLAGCHQITWHAREISSGMYLYNIQAGDYYETRKMLLLK